MAPWFGVKSEFLTPTLVTPNFGIDSDILATISLFACVSRSGHLTVSPMIFVRLPAWWPNFVARKRTEERPETWNTCLSCHAAHSICILYNIESICYAPSEAAGNTAIQLPHHQSYQVNKSPLLNYRRFWWFWVWIDTYGTILDLRCQGGRRSNSNTVAQGSMLGILMVFKSYWRHKIYPWCINLLLCFRNYLAAVYWSLWH